MRQSITMPSRLQVLLARHHFGAIGLSVVLTLFVLAACASPAPELPSTPTSVTERQNQPPATQQPTQTPAARNDQPTGNPSSLGQLGTSQPTSQGGPSSGSQSGPSQPAPDQRSAQTGQSTAVTSGSPQPGSGQQSGQVGSPGGNQPGASGSGSGEQRGQGGHTGGQSGPNQSGGNQGSFMPGNDLADCQGTSLFSVPLAAENAYDRIIPLGNNGSSNGVAGHVFPVGHLYFTLFRSQPGNYESPTVPAAVVAPSDLEIFEVTATDYQQDGKTIGHDYQILFAPCKGVAVRLDHINTLSSGVQKALDGGTKSCEGSFSTGPGSPVFVPCRYSLNLKLRSGDAIGSARGPRQGGFMVNSFDFGVYDLRIPPLPFIDSKYWGGLTARAVCGIGYYSDGPVKTALFNKLQTTRIAANGLPDCGTSMWGKAGTIQGNWVLPGTPGGSPPDNENGLAISRLNTDPNQGDIDWGGTIAPADRILFPIKDSGALNRDPAQVTADGKIHCYEDQSDGPARARSVNVQLVDADTLKVEYHAGACAANASFSKPTTYVR